MRSTPALVAAALVVLAGTAAAAPAEAPAAQAASPREQAKQEFNAGNVAYNLGKYPDAVAHFEKAYALSRLPEILFNLGQCYRKLWEAEGKSELGRRALHYYGALVREAPTSRVRADADQFIAELEPAVVAAEARERQGRIDAARGAEALRLAQSFLTGGQVQDAATVLDRLLKSPDNGPEVLAEAYLLRGRAAARLGDLLGAEGHFRRALELRPAAELNDGQGNENAAFEAAKRTATGSGLRLVQAPLGEVPPDRAARVDLRVEGDSERMVVALELGYRSAQAGAFLTTRAKPSEVLAVPGAALPPGARVDYYVRALDAHGGVLAESGTPTLPFRLQVAAPGAGAAGGAQARGPKPWYGRWWVWTIVGAVALGAGAATYAGTRRDNVTTYNTPTPP
jgi:tetratricopeptide (TPR) repeat protein